MRLCTGSEPHKTLVEALDYSRSTPLVKYRQYVNSPTISAGSTTLRIITRSSILEIKISVSSGEYSVCWMKPYGAGVLEPQKRLTYVLLPDHLPEFELALNTGLHKGSMYSLTWAMVDWEGRMLNIPTSKNGEALQIPLNNAALAALENVHQRGEKIGRVFQSEKTGEPLGNSRHWFEKAVLQAGINDFGWHDLWHCFATKLRMKGAKLEDITTGIEEFDRDKEVQPPRTESVL